MLIRKTPLKRTGFTKKTERPTLQQMEGSGLVQKASSFTQKPRQRLKPRAPRKPGQQSQVDFFKEIWQERKHVSEISGLPLIPMPDDWEDEAHVRAWLGQFSHILPKGAYLKYKERKDNILLKTLPEHEFWEKNKGRAALAYLKEKPSKCVGAYQGWRKCDSLYLVLKHEANKVLSSPRCDENP